MQFNAQQAVPCLVWYRERWKDVIAMPCAATLAHKPRAAAIVARHHDPGGGFRFLGVRKMHVDPIETWSAAATDCGDDGTASGAD